MMQVPLYEVKNDLSRYLRIAEKEDVIITRHGVPAGILIGFEDPEEWWEEALLRHPRFKERIARARQSAREGKGVTIEQLRAELNIDPPTASDEGEN
jgi:prevent-host-death family protein